MTFTFGFNEDDSDTDQPVVNIEPVNRTKYLDGMTKIEKIPKVHDLKDILQSLLDVRISYEVFETPINHNIVYRRELYDIKHQIMCEDNDSTFDFTSDLQKNVYEGGFKSWECSYDLIDKLEKIESNFSQVSILDMGCGTGLPSSYLLLNFFKNGITSKRIILTDFNYDVLRLVTVPNLLLNWLSLKDPHIVDEFIQRQKFNLDDHEIKITIDLIDAFIMDLSNSLIELAFISGSWGHQFNQLVGLNTIDLLLSSETIYSQETLPIIAESIIQLVNNGGRIILAAKNIYFGVGGSIIEFLNYFDKIKPTNFKYSVEEINDSQLKRSLVMIDVD